MAWLDEQWNKPDRTDHYLMQIAGHVANVLSKRHWKLEDYKVRFTVGSQPLTQEEIERKVARSKAAWNARLNRSARRKRYGR